MKKYFTLFNAILAVLLLVFLWGLVRFGFSPRVLLKNAALAADALKKKYTSSVGHVTGKEKSEKYQLLWYKVDFDRSGVTRYDRQRAYDGLTLYSGHESKAYLIDMDGNVVHQWSKPFYDVWPDPSHIIDATPEEYIYWRRVQLLPNGDLIAVYEGINQSPYGGGIIKIDKDSNLLWKVGINAHHDFDVLPNGDIYALEHEYKYISELKEPICDDGIAIISADGKLKEVKQLYKRFAESKYRDWINWEETDPFHTNNVEILRGDLAEKFPMFKQGDILISMRMPNAVFVLDGKNFQPEWGFSNLTVMQHDPDFTDDGTIMVFDNNGTGIGWSQILDFDPASLRVMWHYYGNRDNYFYSEFRGSQQTLPNGNILITESNRGRIFEITKAGEIVWEFIDPSLDSDKNIGVVNWATRYNKKDLVFLTDETKEPER